MTSLSLQNRSLPGGWVSIVVEGEVDLATVPDLQAAIDHVFDNESEGLVVDLNGSTFMDSTGLKTLVMTHRRFDGEGRQFAIAVEGGPVARLIDLSGVNSAIKCVSSVEELDTPEG